MPSAAGLPPEHAITFGSFRLLPLQQLLLENGKPVRLGTRAMDILITLAKRPGELVSKEELVASVWPKTFVEEGNLRVHIAALRRALGDGQDGRRYITNVPGQGYRFLAPVSVDAAAPPAAAATSPPPERPHNLPAPVTRILGRAEVVRSLVSQMPERRLVTIVGPGGIGKTTVALAAATELLPVYRDGVRFVELGPLAERRLVATALASVLGQPVRSEDPLSDLVAFLRNKHMLLLLDSCEHLVEAAAALAETISKAAAHVHILATSREALRAEGERVLRLPPLALPPEPGSLRAAEALSFPAVQLFVERAAATLDGFELGDADAPLVVDICLRLDGNPLAIELAAGRIDAFGVRGLAERLDDRFRLLVRGRRTALPRHKTLAATLDWSYELLPEAERIVLRRLAVFAASFDLPAAHIVAGGDDFSLADISELIAELVAKSLVSADVGGPKVQYRLLNTTRAYALERLVESGELERLARRHAEHCLALFRQAEGERQRLPAAEWLEAYGRSIDDLRTALDWAFSDAGDAALGVSLTLAALPLWWQLSLIDEAQRRLGQALAAADAGPDGSDRQQMQLYAALGWSLMYTKVPDRETGAAWRKALALAEALDDTDYRLRALWGLWAGHQNNGEFGAALALAREFSAVAAQSADPSDRLIGDRMTGAALHFLGDQTGARQHIEQMLAHYIPPEHGADIIRFQFDQQVTATITLARVLWLQGFADQAMRRIHDCIERATSIGHTLSLCNALAQAACPVALLSASPEAERFIDLLLSHTASQGVAVWRAYCDGFAGQRLVARGELALGLPLLRAAVDDLRDANFVQHHTTFLGWLAEGLCAADQPQHAAAAIDEALGRCTGGDERWCLPELLRIKGEVALRTSGPNAAAEADSLFDQSCRLAAEQGALSWELRGAMSLARLWRTQDRTADARELLAGIHARFTEGFGTADLRAAEGLRATLS